MNRPFHRFILAGVVPLFCLTALAPVAEAQSQEVTIPGTELTVPVCKLADLDSNVSFFRAKTYFTVAFNLRNIAESPCAPQPAAGFPQFDPAQGPQTKAFGLCIDCEDRLPDGTYLVRAPVVLNPGDIARQAFRWNTVASTAAVKCVKLRALFGSVLVVAPKLFEQVCSEIAVSRLYPGAFVRPALEDQVPADEAQGSDMFVLSSSRPRYYEGDMFALRVDLANLGFEPPSGEKCPALFLRERSPDGSTRFDEVQPSGFKTCKSFLLGSNRNADWQSGFEVDSGEGSRWAGIGKHTFELFEPVGPNRGGEIRFVRSNKLTVQIDDPALIARTWAGRAQGVGVDVTLDKDTYHLGEDVPLHIAVENFDAPVPIYATSPVWDPYMAIGIEVRDATGRLLPENERYPSSTLWTGHGLGPVLFPPGKQVPIERSLASQGWLPKRPGVYTVVVTWCSLYETHLEPGSGLPRKDHFKTYAPVQATATFRIVGEPSSTSHSVP
jgi:hypothetical protein